MDRRNLLKKSCSIGACGCLLSGLLTGDIQAETEPTQKAKLEKSSIPDWHYTFIKKRYILLMDVLYNRLGPEEFSKTIQEMGRACSNSISMISECKNNPDKYFKMLKEKWKENIVWDKEKGVITISSSERTECFCPLIDTQKMPAYVCNCSLGWQQQTMETVLGKKVDVELLASVLRGDKKCAMKITIKEKL